MSNRIIIPLTMVAVFAASGAAFASEQATGEIKSLNPAKEKLTLSTGQSFRVAKDVKLRDFQKGQTVEVTYDIKNGKLLASSVAMAEPQVFKNSEEGGQGGRGEANAGHRK
jgi:Cu/Ag efflux protein CusF